MRRLTPDEQATLAEEYMPMLKALARRHGRTPAFRFDDAFSAGLLGLAKALHRLDADIALAAQRRYIYRVCQGEILNAYRKERVTESRRRHEPDGPHIGSELTLDARVERCTPSAEETAIGFLERMRLTDELQRAIAALPARKAMVVDRLFFEDASTRTLGDELAISPQRVQQLRGRALATLRPLLEPSGERKEPGRVDGEGD